MKIEIDINELDDAGLIIYYMQNREYDPLAALDMVRKLKVLEDDEHSLLAFAEGFWHGRYHIKENIEYVTKDGYKRRSDDLSD